MPKRAILGTRSTVERKAKKNENGSRGSNTERLRGREAIIYVKVAENPRDEEEGKQRRDTQDKEKKKDARCGRGGWKKKRRK